MSPYPYPHPGFLPALLPNNIQTEIQRNRKPYYPTEYLDKQKCLDSPANEVVSLLACMQCVSSFAALVVLHLPCAFFL